MRPQARLPNQLHERDAAVPQHGHKLHQQNNHKQHDINEAHRLIFDRTCGAD